MKKLNNTQIKFKTLTSLYGVQNSSKRILHQKLGINSRLNFNYIKEKKLNQLNTIINKQLNGRKLQQQIFDNISFLKSIRTYRGLRHRASLPVRGQRTHTNAKTCKKKHRKTTI